VGPFFCRFPQRNHKKLVVVDGRVAYVGGINFSDHNFAWHDLMLRIEDEDVARFLAGDFQATWEGRGRSGTGRFAGLTLHSLDGRTNRRAFASVFTLIAGARKSLFVECPYLTPPFCDPLREASGRGVDVRVVSPAHNNWGLAGDAVAWAAATSGIDLHLYPGRMTHMKAMLVDGRTLVLGSANYDVWSLRFQQEYLAVVTDPAVVADFARRVVAPDLAASGPARPMSRLRQRLVKLELRALEGLTALWAAALGGRGEPARGASPRPRARSRDRRRPLAPPEIHYRYSYRRSGTDSLEVRPCPTSSFP
jgi:cardiolipin synthase